MQIDPLPRLREIAHQQRLAEALTPERDQLIRRALGPPWSYSQRRVAREAGLKQQRAQINRGT